MTLLRFLLWGYPVFLALSGYLAWRCRRDRPWVSWMLVAVAALSTAAMVALILMI